MCVCVLYNCLCVCVCVSVCLCIYNGVCVFCKSVSVCFSVYCTTLFGCILKVCLCVCVFVSVSVYLKLYLCVVKVCACFSVYCTTVFVWMWVSVSALLVQVFSLRSGERGTKKVLEWKKESSTALIPTVTKYHPGCPREGWEGHPGGGGPPVGGQDVLQLPGPGQPLPHHGVPARRWCFPLSFFLPFSFLSSSSPDVKFLILASDFLSPVKVPEVEWWCRGLAWIKDGSLPL